MGAIDLLFSVKPDSEPLHQLAVGSLLRHSPLLQRLGVLQERDADAVVEHQWEPQPGLYDLAVRVHSGAQLFIELKVDSPLSDDQIHRQLQELRAEGRADDRVLYLLLGYTAITAHPRIARISRDLGLAPGRLLVRCAEEVAQNLGSPELLWGAGKSTPLTDPASRDARDLAIAYRDHLLALQQRVRRYATRPLVEWSAGDYFGFFSRCRAEVDSMADADVDCAPSAAGGVVSCTFGYTRLPTGITLYLHFEGRRLCVKLEIDSQERRGRMRDQACALFLRMTLPAPLQFVRPAKLGYGRVMTIGYLEGIPIGPDAQFSELAHRVRAAESLLAAVANKLLPEVTR